MTIIHRPVIAADTVQEILNEQNRIFFPLRYPLGCVVEVGAEELEWRFATSNALGDDRLADAGALKAQRIEAEGRR